MESKAPSGSNTSVQAQNATVADDSIPKTSISELKNTFIQTEKNLKIIVEQSTDMIDKIVEELDLFLLKELKPLLATYKYITRRTAHGVLNNDNDSKSTTQQTTDDNTDHSRLQQTTDPKQNTNTNIQPNTTDNQTILTNRNKENTTKIKNTHNTKNSQKMKNETENNVAGHGTESAKLGDNGVLPRMTSLVSMGSYSYAEYDSDEKQTQSIKTVGDRTRLDSKITCITDITGVSSVAPPCTMNDPLIVMMGIGEYDGLPNLPGVSLDYDNVLNTFVISWKYKVLYQLDDNSIIYTNNKNDIENKQNYKLHWEVDEIEKFVEQARKYLVKNRHNGLIFALSSHGDRDKIIYDSECEEIDLNISIFNMFAPEPSECIKSYHETKSESNHLFRIPKIFCLDCCRGSLKARVTNLATSEESITTDVTTTGITGITDLNSSIGDNSPSKNATTTSTINSPNSVTSIALHSNSSDDETLDITNGNYNLNPYNSVTTVMALPSHSESQSQMQSQLQSQLKSRTNEQNKNSTKAKKSQQAKPVLTQQKRASLHLSSDPEITADLAQVPDFAITDKQQRGQHDRIGLSLADQTETQTQSQTHIFETGGESDVDGEKRTHLAGAVDAIESVTFKSVTKEESHNLATQMANFCKLYANIDGHAVADGAKHGGLFLRSVCKVFRDSKYVSSHKWIDIVLKIREYTKQEATLKGLINFTQLVENEGTLERHIQFGSKNLGIIPSGKVHLQPSQVSPKKSQSAGWNGTTTANTPNTSKTTDTPTQTTDVENEFHERPQLAYTTGLGTVIEKSITDSEDEESPKITITNLSQTNKIAVLVETENTSSHEKRLESLVQIKGDTKTRMKRFAAERFVIIDTNAKSHTFDKVWDSVYVTMFVLGKDEQDKNEQICDRRQFYEDLYFDQGNLSTMTDLIPRCNVVANESHPLIYGLIDGDKCDGFCGLCHVSMELGSYSYSCGSCKHCICKECCHLIICEKTSLSLDVPAIIRNLHQITPKKVEVICDLSTKMIALLQKHKYDAQCEITSTVYSYKPNDSITSNNNKNNKQLQLVMVDDDGESKDSKQNHNDHDRDNGDGLAVISGRTVGGTKYKQWVTYVQLSFGTQNSQRLRHFDDENNPRSYITCALKIPLPDNISQEFKESTLMFETEICMSDKINNIHSISSPIYKTPIRIGNDFYQCTFTTLNGNGRYGPTEIQRYYNNHCHANDTKLEYLNSGRSRQQHSIFNININIRGFSKLESTGVQLWTVPKTGKWKIVCYGAKGGHSISGRDSNTGIINHLTGGKGAKVGGIIKLYKNDVIKILCGQMGLTDNNYGECGGGGGGGTFFILHKITAANPKYKTLRTISKDININKQNNKCKDKNKNKSKNNKNRSKNKNKTKNNTKNTKNKSNCNNNNNNSDYDCSCDDDNIIVDIPLIIASGGNGACFAESYTINGIDGLCDDTCEDRNNGYGGYISNGRAGRGGSFKNDCNIFKSRKEKNDRDYNICNASNFLQSNINYNGYALGGQGHSKISFSCDGGFGGGGGSGREGGGGGGYIGGLVCPNDQTNNDVSKYRLYGALSYNSCEKNQIRIGVSGDNDGHGKIEALYIGD